MIVNPAVLSEQVETWLNESAVANNVQYLSFKTFYYIKEVDRAFAEGTTSYENAIITYITNFAGQYRPIPNANVSDQNFLLNIFYPVDKQSLVENAVDSFIKNKIVAKTHIITSGLESINSVWNCGTPNLASTNRQSLLQLQDNDSRLYFDETKVYGLLQLQIFFCASDTLFGNNVVYKLKKHSDATYTDIKPIVKSFSYATTKQIEQFMNSNTSETIISTNAKQTNIEFIVENNALCRTLINQAHNGTNAEQNELYDLQIAYNDLLVGTTPLSYTETVIITSITPKTPIGDILTIALSIEKASTSLNE